MTAMYPLSFSLVFLKRRGIAYGAGGFLESAIKIIKDYKIIIGKIWTVNVHSNQVKTSVFIDNTLA